MRFLISIMLLLAGSAAKYENPVIFADYSDPDVVRVGGDYWLTASSFNCVPGLPILHSTDLVHWEIVNYALDRIVPEDYFSVPRHGKGVWAPCIKFHDGEFYIYWGDPDFGIYMVKAADPRGKWSEPVLVKAGKGLIDPSPLWDDDGKVYLAHAWAASRSGLNSIITVSEMNAEGTACISDEVLVFDGNQAGNHTVEGAKLYKRNGTYYIFAPAGGVAQGWQLVMKSDNIYGPYEARNVMAQNESDINGPHQGAWVQTPSGEDWFLHFQEIQPYGRVVHLNKLNWLDDGWCVIGSDKDGDGCGTPVRRGVRPSGLADASSTAWVGSGRAESDGFDEIGLGLQWQWNANRQDWFGFTGGYGFLRIYGSREPADFGSAGVAGGAGAGGVAGGDGVEAAGAVARGVTNLFMVPNLLLQKFPGESFAATARLTFCSKGEGDRGGLIVAGLDYAAISLRRCGDKAVLEYLECRDAMSPTAAESQIRVAEIPLQFQESGATPLYKTDILLKVDVAAGGLCTFSYSLDGKKFIKAGPVFQAREGRWVGAKMGLFCTSIGTGADRGWIDADDFTVVVK